MGKRCCYQQPTYYCRPQQQVYYYQCQPVQCQQAQTPKPVETQKASSAAPYDEVVLSPSAADLVVRKIDSAENINKALGINFDFSGGDKGFKEWSTANGFKEIYSYGGKLIIINNDNSVWLRDIPPSVSSYSKRQEKLTAYNKGWEQKQTLPTVLAQSIDQFKKQAVKIASDPAPTNISTPVTEPVSNSSTIEDPFAENSQAATSTDTNRKNTKDDLNSKIDSFLNKVESYLDKSQQEEFSQIKRPIKIGLLEESSEETVVPFWLRYEKEYKALYHLLINNANLQNELQEIIDESRKGTKKDPEKTDPKTELMTV